MGDHRATYRLQFEMHGHKADSGEAWVNWDWASGCDRRVIDWFEKQTRIAMSKWDDQEIKRENEQREANERAEYERLKAKYEKP